MTDQPTKRPLGRPTLYTPELAAEIASLIAEGNSVVRICRRDDMPDRSTVMRWIGQNGAFRDTYVRAMEARGIGHGEQVADVAMQVLEGEIDPDVGRVANDGFKWAAARMAPRVYGDKVALTGADGGPLQIQAVRFAELPAALAAPVLEHVASVTHDTGSERTEQGQVIDNIEDEAK